MRRLTYALGTSALMALSTAANADWLVYAQAGASARGDGYETQGFTKCSGTRASTNYCGASAEIFTDRTALDASASATVYRDPSYNSGYGLQHGDGFASADLATGKLRVSDHASSEGIRSALTGGGGSAQFQDTLHFASASNNPFMVKLRVHVDGLFEGPQQPRFSVGLSNYISGLNGTAAWSDSSDGVPSCVGQPADACGQPAYFTSFNVSGGWEQFGPSDFVGSLLFDSNHLDASFAMSLSAGGSTESTQPAYQATYAEFGHTATVAFELPAGVTFTSDSGVFLSQMDASAVPEPATWATMIGGFGLVGGSLRRRRISARAVLA